MTMWKSLKRCTVQALFLLAMTSLLLITIRNDVVHAQAVTTSAIHITSSVLHPKPNTQVSLSLNDYSTDTTGAEILWYIDGYEKPEFRNERTVSVTTGSLGSETIAEVRVLRNGALVQRSEPHKLTPTQVDIIIEADTYTPSFYSGRALPSSQARIRAIAITHTGSGSAFGSLSYKWTLDGNVVSGGTLTGKYTVDLVVPRFGNGNLSVEVYNTDGKRVGIAQTHIAPVEPVIAFYTYSPLRGLLEKSLGNGSLLTSNTTLYAEPYFLNVPGAELGTIRFEWKVDGVAQSQTEQTRNAIALAKDTLQKTISVRSVTGTAALQYAEKSVRIMFSE